MLSALAAEKSLYRGKYSKAPASLGNAEVFPGDLEVEMQWFTRRSGTTIVVGVDKALAMLRNCSGYWENDSFVDTSDQLEVWAVEDGNVVTYNNEPLDVKPVIRVRGRYRDFAALETPTLGILTRASRVATNVYEMLIAAHGKPLMFFPARFDAHEVQAGDGYAYNIAVQRFNQDYTGRVTSFVSTDSQGDWWGGKGGGTVAHSVIACFLGDTAEAMLAFARLLPANESRIALVDFSNDCVTDTLQVCRAMFYKYMELMEGGNEEDAKRYVLYGVRMDTSSALRDQSVQPLGDPILDLGVTPRLVFNVRQALDSAWQAWNLPENWRERAKAYCHAVKIVVSGGFNPERISRFEKLGVPVDTYAVGSALFDNHGTTITDFTADVVKVKIGRTWIDMAKVGRHACENGDLKRVW